MKGREPVRCDFHDDIPFSNYSYNTSNTRRKKEGIRENGKRKT